MSEEGIVYLWHDGGLPTAVVQGGASYHGCSFGSQVFQRFFHVYHNIRHNVRSCSIENFPTIQTINDNNKININNSKGQCIMCRVTSERARNYDMEIRIMKKSWLTASKRSALLFHVGLLISYSMEWAYHGLYNEGGAYPLVLVSVR